MGSSSDGFLFFVFLLSGFLHNLLGGMVVIGWDSFTFESGLFGVDSVVIRLFGG